MFKYTKDKLSFKLKSKTLGHLKYTLLWGDTPFIEELFVDPGYRNNKIGTNLLKRFIKDFSYYHCILISFQTDNMRVKGLYERIGFRPCGKIDWSHNDFDEILYYYDTQQEEV